MDDDTLKTLTAASNGLLYPSETDAPFEAFAWAKATNTASVVSRMAGLPKAVKCIQQSLDDFFGDLSEEKEFQALRGAIEKTLSDVKVYRCGSIKVTYFVVGTAADGRLAGFKTTAVET
jgi:hypothetical protein